MTGKAPLSTPHGSLGVDDNREGRIRANRRMLETLADLWDAYPDMRFGQLVMNLSRENGTGRFADTWEWKHGQWRERIERAWTEWSGMLRG